MLFIRPKKDEFFKLNSLHKSSFLHIYRNLAYSFVDNIHKNKFTKFKRRFEFRYLNVNSFGAYPDIKRFRLDSVHVNYGSILLIHDLFYKLLCNSSVFPQFGVQKGNLPREVLDFKPFIANKIIHFCMPQDGLRRQLAQICSMIAVEFIILHEIGHHMNGHCLLMKQEKLSKKDRKTIEMDADSFAVTASIQAAFLTSEFRVNSFSQLHLSNLEYIKLWIYIIHIVFLVISKEHEFLEEERNEERYLPRRIRSLLAAQISIELFQKFFPDDVHDFTAIFVQMATVAEMDFNSTFNRESSQIEMSSCYSAELIQHLDEINDHWERVMRPRLEPYARVPLHKAK